MADCSRRAINATGPGSDAGAPDDSLNLNVWIEGRFGFVASSVEIATLTDGEVRAEIERTLAYVGRRLLAYVGRLNHGLRDSNHCDVVRGLNPFDLLFEGTAAEIRAIVDEHEITDKWLLQVIEDANDDWDLVTMWLEMLALRGNTPSLRVYLRVLRKVALGFRGGGCP